MERGALEILGQGILRRQTVGADDAGHRRGAGQPLLLHQQFEGAVAAAADRHIVQAGLVALAVKDRPDGQALQQGAAGDVLRQLLDREAGLDPADVGLRQHQFVEGNVAGRAEGELGLGHVGSPRRVGREPSLRLLNPSRIPRPPLPLPRLSDFVGRRGPANAAAPPSRHRRGRPGPSPAGATRH